MLLSIVVVVLVFFGLVMVHELGHFVVARRNGVRVLEFGIGFPPRLFSKIRAKTRYSVNLLPIGGFVRLKGEDGENKDPDSFASQGYWKKTKIIMAGVTVNLLVAYLIFTFLLFVGMPHILPFTPPSFGPVQPITYSSEGMLVYGVSKDGAAKVAGLRENDHILSVNGEVFDTQSSFSQYLRDHAGQDVRLAISRGGQNLSIVAKLGSDKSAGVLGVVAERETYVRYNWWQAPLAAVVVVLRMLWLTLAGFGALIVGLFTRGQVSDQVAGPIGITALFGQLIHFDWRYSVSLVAALSLSLALINSLPIPALDGGREFVITLQRLGVKIKPHHEQWIHVAGFVLIFALIIIITIVDITRLR
jgi:regulator of sigma E protease